MSRDPLDELFGSTEEHPEPVPARRRLAQEQAERVRTAQLPEQRRGRGRGDASSAVPWIVVGVIAVIAIVASIVVVNLARGAGSEPAATSGPTRTSTESPRPTSPEPSSSPDADDDAEAEKPGDEVPRVEVGPTMELAIPQWGVTSELSSRFGSTSYVLENGNTELWLSSDLIAQLPCEGNWGAVQTAGGKYEVLRPAERCAAAPELYDELWGLTDAFVQTIRPAG
ncbi:hypothetical protein [Leucobacter massiliensis]|uniref:Uncharacterized protein n=1 Tax=Leucobacter massiliensis TaxID=1686285 RepID=A0A2S9QPS1_9MICO|nr:hypothetical protein [Leucobacter massiliensis]PRI11575.1 hypothetical protein B4915_05500 [Leucobacter massiliensis]